MQPRGMAASCTGEGRSKPHAASAATIWGDNARSWNDFSDSTSADVRGPAWAAAMLPRPPACPYGRQQWPAGHQLGMLKGLLVLLLQPFRPSEERAVRFART